MLTFCKCRALPGTVNHTFKTMTLRMTRSIGIDVKLILLAMRITAAILLILSLHVTAKSVSQTITLTGKDIPLKKVFTEIEKQCGYLVLYNRDVIDDNQVLSVEAKNEPLLEFLNETLQAHALDFVIENKTILVKKKPVTPKVNDGLNKKTTLPISGIVKGVDGKPLANVSVTVKGTDKGTTTDVNGNFSIEVNQGEVLVVSSVGFGSREVKINSANLSLVIALDISSSPLEEVVFKGYYESAQRFNTGNVSKVKAEDISRQPVTNILAALQGRVPGLSIQQYSGLPGGSFTVRLRGQNSIANNNNPLYIIDGVPFSSTTLSSQVVSGGVGELSPFNALNPADIASVEILKDADATAIYGSRGANGVILITTKKGKAGKTKTEFTIYQGVGNVMRKMDLLNTQQYLDMRREAFANDGATPQAMDYDVNGMWDTTRYTDWQKIFLGGTAKITDVQGGVSGGSAQTQFNIGMGYRRETTVYPGDFVNKKVSTHFGLNHASSDQKFKVGLSGSYVTDNNRLPVENLAGNIFLAPDAPALYDDEGKLNWQNNTWVNPFAVLYRKQQSVTDNMIGRLSLNYTILPGLEILGSVGYNKIQLTQHRLIPLSSYSDQFSPFPSFRKNQSTDNNRQSWIAEPQINYEKALLGGKLEALVGATFQENSGEIISRTASGFTSDALIDNISAAPDHVVDEFTSATYRYSALYARVGYNWNQKYLVNVTGRRDGSSRFGEDKRFGNFGAIGLGWIFSEENFLKNANNALSYGKIRGSYGVTGNDQFRDYQYLSTYSPLNYSYAGLTGLQPVRLANSSYSWEQLKKLEFGLEAGFFANKLLLNVSWYKNRTDNQLVGYPLPSTTGFIGVQANLPAVIQNTGWELEITTVNVQKKNFEWSTSFNVSFPRNKLVSYPNIEGSPYKNIYGVGKSLWVASVFKYTGVDANTGLYTFEDFNKDGLYSYDGDRYFVFNGQDFFGGLQNKLTFGNVQIDFLFQFVKQKGPSYFANIVPGLFWSAVSNQPTSVLERWQKAGEGKFIQRYSTQYRQENELFENSDARIGDASYVRLKNVSLSWTMPATWSNRLHVSSFRLYMQGQNVFTITSYKGMDPENGSIAVAPIRMLTAGIQLGL